MYTIVLEIAPQTCSDEVIRLSATSNLLSSAILKSTCRSIRQLTLTSDKGQRMNVSLWDFAARQQLSYGTLRDEISGNTVDVTGSGNRRHRLVTTIGNTAHLQFSRMDNSANFLLDITGTLIRLLSRIYF